MADGTLMFSSQSTRIAASDSEDLSFNIPPGGVAKIKSMTAKIQFDSDDIDVSEVKITRRGESQTVDLTKGTMNLKEYVGDGRLPRVMPIIETADQNSVLTLKLTNNDPSASVLVNLTHEFELIKVPFADTARPSLDERLLMFNVTNRIAAQSETRFVFTAPKLMNAKIKESTFAITPDSEHITIKDITLVRPYDHENVGLLDGTMNIKELCGDGQLSRVFQTIETLQAQEDLIVLVRNDETDASIRVQLTMWMILVPKSARG